MNIKRFLKNPVRVTIRSLSQRGKLDFVSDKLFLKLVYRSKFGRKLNLDNPVLFNEKLQWLKLYNRNPKFTSMVDKYEVKQYVAKIVGDEYIIPTLGVWDSFEEINFEQLPEQFVLKCTHDSGGVIICDDKSKFDIVKSKEKIDYHMKRNYFYVGREWPYKNVKPRIIAEAFLKDDTISKGENIKDYKVYCFDGVAKLMQIGTNCGTGIDEVLDFVDKDFNWIDMTWGKPHSKTAPDRPDNFEEIIALAEKLSKGLVHIRVDLFSVCGKIYFGEYTFFDGSGFDEICPIEMDKKLGSWLNLNK